MRFSKTGLLLLILIVALSGCASRIGYPAKAVGIPTPVTLFVRVDQKATIIKDLDYLGRGAWSFLYEKRTQEVLDKISREALAGQLKTSFVSDVEKAKELFAPSSSEVRDIEVEYSKSKSDPAAYSGFDFSSVKDSVPTRYILALTIDEWGHIVATKVDKNGPYIRLTMQLIDKDTNESAWRYSYLFQEPVDKAANELTVPALLEHIIVKLIERSVDQYFLWLSFK
jgi:hypothetical protein